MLYTILASSPQYRNKKGYLLAIFEAKAALMGIKIIYQKAV